MAYDIKSQMLIRKPPAEVYDAFVDPAKTTRFWFTQSSGRLEQGKPVRWSWEMYDAHANVTVKELVPGARIAIEWDGPGPRVAWTFTPHKDGTLVVVENSGLPSVEAALDAKGGFTFLLAGLKAYLEHGIELALVADHYPR